jgi:uncharacterized protein
MTALPRDDGYVQKGVLAPETDPDSDGWWAAVRAGRFVLPHCRACGHDWFPPTPRCPRCASAEVELTDGEPYGVVHSWIVVHRALDEAFVDDTPYTIVAVTLAAGARMFGRLLAGEPSADLAVEARTYRAGDEVLLGFAPRSAG